MSVLQDICVVESHVLHIPACSALIPLRNGMGKSAALDLVSPNSKTRSSVFALAYVSLKELWLYIRNNRPFAQ